MKDLCLFSYNKPIINKHTFINNIIKLPDHTNYNFHTLDTIKINKNVKYLVLNQ